MERRENLEHTRGKKSKPRAETMERRANLEQKPWKEEET